MNTTFKKYASIALQLLIAIIYVQTLYYKFSAHPDSVYIFSALGLEPYGRIGLGIIELITAILIVYPATKIYGGIISVGIISGAIFSHLGPLGIEIKGDEGKVFYLAVVVFVASILFLLINYKAFINLIQSFKKTK
jgi:putative oxidoreductase